VVPGILVLLALATATPAAPPVAESLREGFALFARDDYAGARRRFEAALAAATAAGDPAAEAEARRGLGRVLFRTSQYPAAREELERARELYRAASDALGEARAAGHLGSVAVLMGDSAGAAELFAHALAAFQTLGARADELETRFNLLYVPADAAAQARQVEEGLALARAVGDRTFEALFLNESADLDFAQGRFASASAKLEEAVRAFEQVGARRDLGRALNSLSRIQRTHGQVERALDLSGRALAIQEELSDVSGALQSLDQMADARSQLGQHREALALYQKALGLARGTESPHLVAILQGRLSQAHLRMGQPARAVELLEGVIARGVDAERAPTWYVQLSRAYRALGRLPEALAAADKALELARASAVLDRVLPALHARAAALQRLGRREEALAAAQEQVAGLERLRAELVPDDFMKRGFGDQHQAVFELTVGLLTGEGRHREALETAEQARARAFLDLLATRQERPASGPAASPTGGLPSAIAAPAASVDEIAATARRLGSTVVSYFVGQEELFIWVVGPDGQVRAHRAAVPADRVWELVRETRTALRDAGARRRTRGGAAGPDLATRGGGRLLVGGGGPQAWRRLHDLLIAPVRALLPRAPGSRLTIVPHGPLFLVSFAALRDARGRYLVEDYALHYAPSAAVLQMTASRAGAPAGLAGRRVFVADPGPFPEEAGRPLAPLPGTRREVRASAGQLPGGDNVVLSGGEATEANVRRLAAGASLLHFATHGIVRDGDPLESFLALRRGTVSGGDDGRLTVQDIYGLDLQASLVVLSACRTGLGQLSSDGIVGLTRAFFYAGAPSVVATLWDVADEPTFRLVSGFYARLAREPDKARALRATQLSMLRALRAGKLQVATAAGPVTLPEHPVLWAGFVLVGEP
jgi:CHAT domain-containing protein/tetratricopeptide (TPR) repeat protein